MPNTFLGSSAEEKYDEFLNFPVIRTIRSQEKSVLQQIFETTLAPINKVLEIGAGNGFYTSLIAPKVGTVLALEPSHTLARQLETKILQNVKVAREDFFNFQAQEKFDHVIAIGVLDYVPNWQEFLTKARLLSSKSLIFSAPQKGLWSNLYKFGSKFEKVKIFNYSKQQFNDFFADNKVEISEAGLASGFTKGLTLIVKVNING